MRSDTVRLQNGLGVFYRESGNGSVPVVFVPGWTMSSEVFEQQLACFEGSEDYRFISYDPRSHGFSSQTADGHDYLQHGEDLAQFIEALDLSGIVLAGWSFGTLATLAYVRQSGAGKVIRVYYVGWPAARQC